MSINKINQNNQGIISFFTVIFLTTLLIIITTAFIRLMVSEQRQATDNDLSSRAFFAAESGVDDAIALLRDNIKSNGGKVNQLTLGGFINQCGSEVNLNTDSDISYTCRFISFNVTSLSGQLERGEIVNFDLVGVPNAVSARLKWHIPNEDNDGPNASRVLFNGQTWPGIGANRPASEWTTDNVPALMRLQTISYPSLGLNSANINNNISFAYPDNSGSPNGSGDVASTSKRVTACTLLASTSSNYACQFTFLDIDGPTNHENKFLRLQALNNKTSYELQLLDGANNPVVVPDQVVIDVTGKAGNVFRRIRVTVPLNTGDADDIADHALLVDERICKNFEVSDSGGPSSFLCNGNGEPLTP